MNLDIVRIIVFWRERDRGRNSCEAETEQGPNVIFIPELTSKVPKKKKSFVDSYHVYAISILK